MIAILTYTNITLSSSEAVPPWWCSPLPSVGHLLGPCPSRKRGTPRKEALTPWGRTKATKVVSPNKKNGYSARKWVSGWWYTYPSEKYESQLGWFFPIYGKVKNVPNHQSGVGRFLPWLVSFFGVWDKILFEVLCAIHMFPKIAWLTWTYLNVVVPFDYIMLFNRIHSMIVNAILLREFEPGCQTHLNA